MKFDALFDAGFKELGARFFLVAFLPMLVVALVGASLIAAGAPAATPSWRGFVAALDAAALADWAGLLFAVLVLAFVSMPLQDALVRVFEGYWGKLATTRPGRWCVARQRQARAQLLADMQHDGQPGTADAFALDSAARRFAAHYPADASRVLPTRLGNALRAAEDLATYRYGLDSIVIWPRLYPYLGDALSGLVDSARNQLDMSVRLVVTFLLCALVSLALLFDKGWWWLMPIAFAGVARLAYRAAVEAAVAFGAMMNAAIDLRRFDLLDALHLPLPADLADERRRNAALSEFLRQGGDLPLGYAHPEKPGTAGGGAAEDALRQGVRLELRSVETGAADGALSEALRRGVRLELRRVEPAPPAEPDKGA
ncbi:hypothetical protein Bsp3421_003652 [Burkholderia sp. FERM BP-3421]|uniref:hypothetical protein n=1 Tax=Burkholderia sp. FERM BP-3421 TaxID=1494466 RepID=UPI00235F5602|nr:hypothetical protein [Burkholderia sp. FERM BP-3421]WDD93564.1 hypothetical protein Bsp3421_003652 [Burkholderia sp. FERM BP-3421]